MTEIATPRRGRITPEREAELYEAVLVLLREVGYDALTMDAVAARTRASKATLYRQWGGKAELVAKAVRHKKPGGAGTRAVDTGSLRGDLHALTLRQSDSEIAQSCALMRGLAMAVHSHPDLQESFLEYLIDPETADLRTVVQRAVDRGEVHPDNRAIDYLLHLMTGVFVSRLFVEERPPTQAFLISYVDAVVLPALLARPDRTVVRPTPHGDAPAVPRYHPAAEVSPVVPRDRPRGSLPSKAESGPFGVRAPGEKGLP